MYLSILGDQSLIFNWRWGSRHVYIAIFSVFGSGTSLLCLFCWFGSAPTLLVQVDWASGIALWVPTLSVKSLYNISENGWFGTMVREPFCYRNSQIRGHKIVLDSWGSRTWLDAMVRKPFRSRTSPGFFWTLPCQINSCWLFHNLLLIVLIQCV